MQRATPPARMAAVSLPDTVWTPVLYAHAETATYKYGFFYLNGGSEREWVAFLFVGGGFVQPLGERSWLNFQVLFDVMQSDKSPYEIWEPFFSIGVGTGF